MRLAARPTDPVVVAHEGSRELVQMRWGLVRIGGISR